MVEIHASADARNTTRPRYKVNSGLQVIE